MQFTRDSLEAHLKKLKDREKLILLCFLAGLGVLAFMLIAAFVVSALLR